LITKLFSGSGSTWNANTSDPVEKNKVINSRLRSDNLIRREKDFIFFITENFDHSDRPGRLPVSA
jgi:hypothetical protein